jgi:hypothetical protein
LDEPTLGEIVRRLEDMRQDLRDDLRELAARLDSKVSMERYLLEQQSRDEAMRLLIERVKGIEDARTEERQQRERDRRLVFTALVAPVLLMLLTAYLGARGAAA